MRYLSLRHMASERGTRGGSIRYREVCALKLMVRGPIFGKNQVVKTSFLGMGQGLFIIWVIALSLVGCANPQPDPESEGATLLPVQSTAAPARTLVPTFTPLPDVSQLPTWTPAPGRPQATEVPVATINFSDPVIQLEYKIPTLGLDRRLEGNISSQIAVIDQLRQLTVQRSNQGNILLELQQTLPQIGLSPLPDGCDACVYLQYELPLAQESREGWLQDPVIIASLDNYMSISVGPHFPPDTLVGLRRNASPYYPAHTVAFTADGRVYTWLATEAQVAQPVTTSLPISATLADLPLEQLSDRYVVDCVVEPVEVLHMATTADPLEIIIRCPAYSLPAPLLPLYLQLDEILAAKLASYTEGPPRPSPDFPLDALLDYKRLDGNRLTLFADGQITVQNTSQVIFTGTITTTNMISLTTDLLASGQLQPGLTTFLDDDNAAAGTPESVPVATPVPQSPVSLLLVRSNNGVYDGEFDSLTLPFLADLNALLDSILELAEPVATGPPEVGTPAGSEESQSTPTPTPSS